MSRSVVLCCAIVIGCLMGACGGEEPGERQAVETPRGQGKADGSNSCQNICGQQARSGCWCDAQCSKYGDCCPDKSQFCDSKPASCVGLCGAKNPAGCWCDAQCSKYGDCCADKAAACDAPPVDKCAGVTCTPSPATCAGDELVTVKSATCDPATGKCVETTQKTSCPHGCESGACKAAPPPPPPPPTSSFWDDALLSGSPITAAAAVARFAPGTTSVAVGPFEIRQRARTCNATTGCGAWLYPSAVTFAYMSYELWIPGPGWSPQKSCFQFKAASFQPLAGKMSFVIGNGGQVNLQLASGPTGTVACTNVSGAKAPCGNFSSTGVSPTGGKSCNLPNPSGGGFDPLVYPASVTLYDTTKTTGSALSMSVLVTEKYVYGRSKTQSEKDSAGSYTEVEYALYGSLDGSPIPGNPTSCTPTTCSAQGKTCGSIPDGCGGTLSCGSCSYPYNCGSNNTCELPPNCNLQPCYAPATVSYTCCSPGKVTCPNGKGCTCYDACY